MLFVVLSGVFKNVVNQTRSKKLHMPHIWYQIKEKVVFFKMKTTCDCHFLSVFEIGLGGGFGLGS